MPRPPTLAHPWVKLLALAAVVAVAWWRWSAMTAHLVPYVDWDTQVFEQVAQLPLGFGLLGSSKPLLVPLIFRAAGNDHAAIVAIQTHLAFVAWVLLAASLATAVRRPWVRALAVLVGVAFLLSPTRIGFTASLMSESVADSLTALLAAGVIALVRTRHRGARIALVLATALVATAWILSRDTNAFVAVVAAATAMIVGRGWRSRRAWLATAAVVAVAAVALRSTGASHPPLPYQASWDVRLTPRAMYPLVDNLYTRAPSAIPPELRRYLPPDDDWHLFPEGPTYKPLQDWIVSDGSGAYARWLVRHPLDRVADLFAARWTALTAPNTTYMPGGWDARGIPVLSGITHYHWLLGALLVLSPLLLWRPRADRLRALALCMLASGLVGIAAAFYGDAAEIARHCYCSGQQVVLALFVALLARLDRRATWRG